jgi:hypothetical protein
VALDQADEVADGGAQSLVVGHVRVVGFEQVPVVVCMAVTAEELGLIVDDSQKLSVVEDFVDGLSIGEVSLAP